MKNDATGQTVMRAEDEERALTHEAALIAAHIEPHPHRPGEGEVRLRVADGGVPVWAIIGALTESGDNADAVAHDYDVPRDAVHAAWMYYGLHRDAIDRRLAENESA